MAMIDQLQGHNGCANQMEVQAAASPAASGLQVQRLGHAAR